VPGTTRATGIVRKGTEGADPEKCKEEPSSRADRPDAGKSAVPDPGPL
jgi:hypothetical protein